MFERSVDEDDVRQVLQTGKIIEDYPQDRPYPSRLMLGWIGSRPLHVVAAESNVATFIITVYEPDPQLWEPGFAKRRFV